LRETTYNLESGSGPQAAQLTGRETVVDIGPRESNGRTRKSDEALKGTIGPDGKVRLAWGPYGQFTVNLTYVEEGGKAILRASGPGCYQCPIVVTDYVGGQATGENTTVTLYDYAFSPEFMTLITGSNPPSVVVGSYQAGEVTKLALTIETRAQATFAWQSTPNEVARVLLGDGAVAGKGAGRVEFAKKPDGSWFVDSVSVQ
jgi:hypothetical protein